MSKRRRDEDREKLRQALILLGLLCLIQFLICLRNSRMLASDYMRSRDKESRDLERRSREDRTPAPKGES